MSVRLYGRGIGRGSLAVVTEGFRSALQEADLLEGFVALDKSGGSEEDEGPPGALARDGVFVGPLNRVNTMRAGTRHERHWVMVTPNSTYLPPNLLSEVLAFENINIMSPSPWATGVVLDALLDLGFRTNSVSSNFGHELVNGDKRVTVHIVRHGVAPGFAPSNIDIARARADYDAGLFRVVHFSTTEGRRKGTVELVAAWEILKRTSGFKDAELLLVLDYHASEAFLMRRGSTATQLPHGVRIVPRANLEPAHMSKLLGHMHVLAAPSRGEGFGLTVLEARAAGVPFVATGTTGHGAGHLQGGAGLIVADSGVLGPIDDGPGAVAPLVDSAALARTLALAQQTWMGLSHQATQGAASVQAIWSWQNQLQPLVRQLRA